MTAIHLLAYITLLLDSNGAGLDHPLRLYDCILPFRDQIQDQQILLVLLSPQVQEDRQEDL